MAILKNKKHEKFAQLVAQGESAVSAYRKAYKASQKSAEKNASRLKENEGVTARIKEIQGKAEDETVLSLIEKRRYLAAVVRTPFQGLTAESPLLQSVKTTTKLDYSGGGDEPEVIDVMEYKVPDKLRALELDAKLAGEFKERVEHDVTDALANVMKSIRGKRDSATE